MDINLTLLGEMITFAFFVWFTMRFVWPPISAAIEAREDQIAEGIAKGRQGEQNLLDAQEKAAVVLQEARDDAGLVLDRANQRADNLLSEAKTQSQQEATRLLDAAKDEVGQMVESARGAIQKESVDLASNMVAKLLKGLDEKQQKVLLSTALDEGQ